MKADSNLSRTIALIAASLSLFSACGIGYRNTTPIPPPPPPPPLAKLSLSTTALIFGPTIIDTSSPPQQLTITNQDTTPLTLASIDAHTNHPDFVIDSTTCNHIEPGKSCIVNILYHPKFFGYCFGRLTLFIAGHTNESIKLTGEGIPPPPSP